MTTQTTDGAETTGPPGAWLTPSAALTHTAPDANDAQLGVLRTRRVVRYGIVVGDFGLLLRQGTHSEVVGDREVSPLPNTPPWLVGLTNMRGSLVPVFDPHMLLEVIADRRSASYANPRSLLVLGQGEGAAGLLVDGLPQPQYPEEHEHMRSLPELPNRLRDHVPWGYLDADRLWLDFDHRGFLAALRPEFQD